MCVRVCVCCQPISASVLVCVCVCVCVCVVNLYQHLYLCVCVCVEVLKLFVSLGRVECTDSSFLMQITLMISCYNLHTFDKDELVIEDV